MGAEIRTVTRRGKGHVVRRAFADIDADVYILADADGTYDASQAGKLVSILTAIPCDMVVGAREGAYADAFPPGHRIGNKLFNALVRTLFEQRFSDVFSGYRALSRRFVKSFPSMSRGFEIETELSLHAIQLGAATVEIPTPYRPRLDGSRSKLKTYQDGIRILWTLIRYFMHYQPLVFYGWLSVLLAILSVTLGIPVIEHFIETKTVPRVPTALLATGIMLLSGMALTCGLILDNIRQGLVELKRLEYLRYPMPGTEMGKSLRLLKRQTPAR
jgi:hypothetical protein